MLKIIRCYRLLKPNKKAARAFKAWAEEQHWPSMLKINFDSQLFETVTDVH